MPLPNTRVIPEGWSAHHRPVAEGGMTATVQVRHPGGTPGEFDPVTGTRPNVPHAPHHTGQARIQVAPVFGGGEAVAGGQEITTVAYLVAIELDGSDECKVDDLVKVTAVDDNGDPALVGRTLTVTGVARGSLAWERDLVCTDDLG